MNKKIIFLISGILLTVSTFATTWKFEGGLDGKSGLTIVYKTLPPLIIDVDEPEMMVVPRGNQMFRYSEVSRSKQPLNVSIKVFFNKSIVEDNGINKNIVRTLYDTVRLSFSNAGKFELIKKSGSVQPKSNDITVDGEVFFTNRNGAIEGNNGKLLEKKIGDSIQNGILSEQEIYIDARFNNQKKEMLSGQYEGKVTLEIEFIGKGAIQ